MAAKAKTAKKGPAKSARAKARGPKPIPEGFGTVTAHLVIEGAGEAMDFYKRAFGAQDLGRMMAPDGRKLMHGLMQIGDSKVMVVDAFEQWGVKGPKGLGGTAVSLHIYVPDVDRAFQRAVDAGCTVSMPLADMFWGDRYGKLKDPFGHEWSMATHVRDLSPAEMDAAMKAAMAEPPKPAA